MDLETIKQLNKFDSNGRPSKQLTDKSWQEEFKIRRLLIKPFPPSVKKISRAYSRESGKWNVGTQGVYHGCTSYQSYCAYINDVLENIRRGQKDYCYYIYQITDLLKFHLDDLQTKYCNGYWEVWLKKKW